VTVRVWRPPQFMTSTIGAAEGMAVAPVGEETGGDSTAAAAAEAALRQAKIRFPGAHDSRQPPVALQPVDVEVTYLLHPLTRELSVGLAVDASRLVVAPGRVGVQVLVAEKLDHVRYYGLGPHENYPDRRSSAVLAVHESTTSRMHTPYVVPGENGARCATRWLQLLHRDAPSSAAPPLGSLGSAHPSMAVLEDSEHPGRAASAGAALDTPRPGHGTALSVSADAPVSFSVQPYTTEDLSRATHESDLVPRPFSVLNLDASLGGVGGDDSWSACIAEQYLVRPAVHRNTLHFLARR